MDAPARMRALVDQLNTLAHHYYVLDEPLASDKEYDALFDELLALERDTGAVLPDSPTQRVGGPPVAGFAQHTHLARLWSLDKARTEGELAAWAQRAERLKSEYEQRAGQSLPPLRYAVEYKFDGLTLNLTYDGGLLAQAATRGDGVTGEAILPQVKTIRSVPLRIPFEGRMEVQGEALMRLSVLEEYNRTADEPLKNARNAAAGALRNLDPAQSARRKLDLMCYGVGYIQGKTLTDHARALDFIRDCGLPLSPFVRYCDTLGEVLAAVAEVQAQRDTLDWLIDGVVVKICDFATREALGTTNRFPRWSIAWKFEAQETTTTVLRILWDAGRTGKLTPTAELEPVELAGVTVKRATLNNYDDILRKRVHEGARVFIRRSNDVIPEIMGAVEEDDAPFAPPDPPHKCPACESDVVRIGALLYCPNGLGCPPQIASRIVHYCSRGAADIEGISDKTVQSLLSAGVIADVSDLYALRQEDIQGLPGFAEKKAQNIITAVDKSRDLPLERFLYALGIPTVGERTARDIARQFGTLAAVREATAEQLMQVRDVGGIVAQNIVDFFADEHSSAVLDRLLGRGVRPQDAAAGQSQSQAAGALAGKTVVITGTLPTLSRKQAEELLLRHGAAVSGSVSKNTSYLLLGEDPGSKYQKALQLGVPLLDEAQLLAMTGESV